MNKDAFIGRISRALGREAVPTCIEDGYDYGTGLQFERLRGLDAVALRACLAAQARVRQFTYVECDSDGLSACLQRIVDTEKPHRVVVPQDTSADGVDLKSAVKNVALFCYHKKTNPLKQRAIVESADMSITIPYRAVADTGTVLEMASEDCGKSVSLLPQVHVSVIFQSRIRATMTDVACELDAMQTLPGYFLFISGPSFTADIESVIVSGVHGPIKEYYVVVKDL